jgi:hypothetical protein
VLDEKQEDYIRLKFGPDIICHIVANQPDCFFDGEISSLLAYFCVLPLLNIGYLKLGRYGTGTVGYKSVFRIRDILTRVSTNGLRIMIRIWILLSSAVTFKMPKK